MLYDESDHSGLESEEDDFPFSDDVDTFSFIRPINRPPKRSFIKPTENINFCDGLKRFVTLLGVADEIHTITSRFVTHP